MVVKLATVVRPEGAVESVIVEKKESKLVFRRIEKMRAEVKVGKKKLISIEDVAKKAHSKRG